MDRSASLDFTRCDTIHCQKGRRFVPFSETTHTLHSTMVIVGEWYNISGLELIIVGIESQ